ncbi:MAG TPA: ChbG/HpnK family deacetylase [Solirubrobacterales bacterium]|nr:ChbG/HpnK family deacetylase [Solirubrobacterales bacterium]
MSDERFLVVNADDLGLSEAVDEGIFRAHAEGVVTSASLMVRQGASPAAAEAAPSHPELAIGLHIDLGEWIYGRGEWIQAYLHCDTDDRDAVEAECRAQLERFRALLGRDPTHLDSHQHVHESEPVAGVAETLAAELGIPLRNRAIRYEGGFYGQSGKGEPFPDGISPERLAALIRELPPGWTEIGCHPAAGPVPTSSYDVERQVELRTLCDPSIREALNVTNVKLCSFAQVNRPWRRTFGS